MSIRQDNWIKPKFNDTQPCEESWLALLYHNDLAKQNGKDINRSNLIELLALFKLQSLGWGNKYFTVF